MDLFEPTMAGILPKHVRCVETRADVTFDTLVAIEQAAVRWAAPRRQAEFATVRACAREALAGLGVDLEPILPGAQGAPIWPRGVVGSMTHCSGYRAAAVSFEETAASIGIDAESNDRLPDRVLELVARPEELYWLPRLAEAEPAVSWDRLLFSIKESVYKAYFPMERGPLSFADVSVEVDPYHFAFAAHLLITGRHSRRHRIARMNGAFAASDSLLLTAVVLSPA